MNHYISLPRHAGQIRMMHLLQQPGVAGLQVRYPWNTLERDFDEYSLGPVMSDASLCAKYGKKLIVMIETKSFDKPNPMPPYMDETRALPNRRNGYTAALWKYDVMDRLISLMEVIDTVLSDGYEGISVQETSLGLDSPDAYTAVHYQLQLARMIIKGGELDGNFYWYFNYLNGGQDLLNHLVELAANSGVWAGGPDILPGDDSLERVVYPIIRSGPRHGRYFNSAQFDSYRHRKPNGNFHTPEEILNYAVAGLRATTVFWNDKDWRSEPGEYVTGDALALIAGDWTETKGGNDSEL